jgi:protein involved in polysaccharide export with SLBB domain
VFLACLIVSPLVSQTQDGGVVYITGEVVTPGQFAIKGPTHLVQVIALAGGLTRQADRRAIEVTHDGTTRTFNFDTVVKQNASVQIEPGDIVRIHARSNRSRPIDPEKPNKA